MDFGYLKEPPLQRLGAYWNELRGAERIPARAAFDPLQIPELLPTIWLYRYQPAEDDWLCHVAGDRICQTTGQPMQKRYVRELFPADVARVINQRFGRIIREEAIFYSFGSVYALQGRYTQGERVGLPLLDDAGVVSWVVGVTYSSGSVPKDVASLEDQNEPTKSFFPIP